MASDENRIVVKNKMTLRNTMVVRKWDGGLKKKMAVRKQDGGLKKKLHGGNKMTVWKQDGVEHWLKK